MCPQHKPVTLLQSFAARMFDRHVITPVQEGLNTLTFTRHVSVMSITLSTVPLDPTRPGYQAPLPLDQVKPLLPPSRSHPGAGLVPRHVPSCHGDCQVTVPVSHVGTRLPNAAT